MKTTKTRLVLIIILSLFITFCTNKKVKKPVIKKIEKPKEVYWNELSDYKKMNEMSNRMILGDTVAYYKINDYYYLGGHAAGFIIVALEMANKNSYPPAYFEVYQGFHAIDNNYRNGSTFVEVGLSKLDPESRNLAFSYLKKAAAKGHKKAIEELKKYDSRGNLRK